MTRIVPKGQDKLVVLGPDGSQRVYDGYDTVEVEALDDTGYEFERPVSAHLEPGLLLVDDQHSARSFRLEEVEEVTIWDHAPARPLIVAGATLGAAILGGFIGYQLPGKCNHDSDMGCLANAYFAVMGTGIGFGLGLGISIPVSGVLRPEGSPKPALPQDDR